MRSLDLQDRQRHQADICSAKVRGYTHLGLQAACGLNDAIVQHLPEQSTVILLGEGPVARALNRSALEAKQCHVVGVDREDDGLCPPALDSLLTADLLATAAEGAKLPLTESLRRTVQAVRHRQCDARRNILLTSTVRIGAVVYSHIGRYVPETDTTALLSQSAQSLLPGGRLYVVDRPACARSTEALSSPGFAQARQLTAENSWPMQVVLDDVLAPVLSEKQYYTLRSLQRGQTAAEEQALFDLVAEGQVRFAASAPTIASQGELYGDAPTVYQEEHSTYRLRGGRRLVGGWGVRLLIAERTGS